MSARARPTRTTVLEVRLRAVRPGRWQLGPARAVQGRDTVEAAAVVVDVTASRAATASTLNPRLRASAGPGAAAAIAGKAAVDLIVSADSVRVGEQVDVVTAAWFPRDLRLQLRRPPTLQPPVIDGVWSYPQATPAGHRGHAQHRRAAGTTSSSPTRWSFRWCAGTVAIPRAMLKYSTPVALQFFSQEERFALTSQAETLAVRALPDGRAARRLQRRDRHPGSRLERRVTPVAARVGEGVDGRAGADRGGQHGALARARAPLAAGLRGPTATRSRSRSAPPKGGSAAPRPSATWSFPIRSGPLTLPAVSYAYFDLAAQPLSHRRLPAASIPVAPGGEATASTALPPPLMSTGGALASPGGSGTGFRTGSGSLVLLAPPLLVALPRAAVRSPPAPSQPAARRPRERRGGARRGRAHAGAGPGPSLGRRARGRRACGGRRCRAGRSRSPRCASGCWPGAMAPAAGGPEDAALAAEVRELVAPAGRLAPRLGGRGAGRSAVGRSRCGPPGLLAQAPSPEALYEQGSLRAAAEGFARRAEREPAVAAHWYNLGAAYYRLGQDGRAAAAWLQARRLAPRAPASVAQALRLTPPPDATSARWTWSPPVTAEELLLLGALGWIAGWLGWTLRPRVRERWLVLLVFSAAALRRRAWPSGLAPASRSPSCWIAPRCGSRLTGSRPPSPRSSPAAPCGSSAAHRAGSWWRRRARSEDGSPTRRSPPSAARFSRCPAASPFCPMPSPTRSPRAKWSSAPLPW